MTNSTAPSSSLAAPARAQFRLDVSRPWSRSIDLTADDLHALTGDATANSVELFGAVWYRVTPVTHPAI